MVRPPASSRHTMRPFWLPKEVTAICTGTVGTLAAQAGELVVHMCEKGKVG